MKKVNVYEDNGGQLHAVVMEGGKVLNIISGFEQGGLSTAEFIDAARGGFEYADEFDPEQNSGASMDEIVETMEADPMNYDLIAEIDEDNVELHLNKMGCAGAKLFSVER